MRAFVDKTTGILNAWGFAVANNDDLVIEVPDDFSLVPGQAKYMHGMWLAHAPTPNWIAANTAEQSRLMKAAEVATFGHADAFAHGLLNEQEVATYKAWAIYKLALAKVDLTQATPVWPEVPTA